MSSCSVSVAGPLALLDWIGPTVEKICQLILSLFVMTCRSEWGEQQTQKLLRLTTVSACLGDYQDLTVVTRLL